MQNLAFSATSIVLVVNKYAYALHIDVRNIRGGQNFGEECRCWVGTYDNVCDMKGRMTKSEWAGTGTVEPTQTKNRKYGYPTGLNW
jgi:hypothetical protein